MRKRRGKGIFWDAFVSMDGGASFVWISGREYNDGFSMSKKALKSDLEANCFIVKEIVREGGKIK